MDGANIYVCVYIYTVYISLPHPRCFEQSVLKIFPGAGYLWMFSMKDFFS